MPRLSTPRPSPQQTITLGRRRLKVGDTVTLSHEVVRIGPYGRGADRPGVTIRLPDGTLHTINPEHLAER